MGDPGSAAQDAALVVRARDGDGEAFGRLVRRHLRAAHAAAFAVLGDSADAEDICQDAFVTALTRLEDCRPEGKFRSWLLAIVRNRAIDLLRRHRARRTEPLKEDEGPGGALSDLPGGDPEPLRTAERADVREHLVAAIATLTATRREVLLLHDLEGWSHPEIATHLGLAAGTVRAHLFWARKDLRARLSPELGRGSHETD